MLRLKNIVKNYKVAGAEVPALKGLNISFRKNEFVSILGPSGCGKTTLLNIIGGLDKYTSGDLFISGRSTKEFKDRDWDIYRNHRVGFIFQAYNLIPHQTILGNVELALTIAGVSKEERVRRSKAAIDKVGLQGQYYKKPNQLSGGQCQRVAIARALVNEPEILLADEPTGALDTKTSIQIMELIKEISKEKLVIMVTHNPELAEQYSSRIIKLLDGNVLDDSNPFSENEEIEEVSSQPVIVDKKNKKKIENAKMSWFTAFRLSFRNLLSKFKRSALVTFAGSIGIIGVSSVLSVSAGIKGYIADMQDDMLSGNPITVKENSLDLTQMMSMMTTEDKAEIVKELGKNEAGVSFVIDQVLKNFSNTQSIQVKNTITQDYIDYVKAMPEEYLSAVSLKYGVDLTNNIYTEFHAKNGQTETLSLSAIKNNYMKVLGEIPEIAGNESYITSLSNGISQGVSNKTYVESQYNVHGKVATEANEIMVVLDKEREINDLSLVLLGYYNQDEYIDIAKQAIDNKFGHTDSKYKFTYDELLGKKFTYYPHNSIYTAKDKTKVDNVVSNLKNLLTGPMFGAGMTEDEKNQAKQGLEIIISVLEKMPFYNYNHNLPLDGANATELKVVGVLEPKEGIQYGSLRSGIYYTEALTKKMLEDGKNSNIKNSISENAFTKEKSITSTNTKTYITQLTNGNENIDLLLTAAGMTEVYSSKELQNTGITYDLSYVQHAIDPNSTKTVTEYVGEESQMNQMMGMISGMLPDSMKDKISNMKGTVSKQITSRELGLEEIANSISIYPVNFEMKQHVTDYLDKWNGASDITVNGKTLTPSQREEIKYSDPVGMIITLVNTLINVITIALIVFTALSLVVSCVMIAIITYVSVMERIKEIGVIRSLGGRKKDVSNLFNAETFMLGFSSGAFGIIITFILTIIGNIIVNALSGGMVHKIAILTPLTAGIMILVSILLTAISGLIPARSAAKKDPVVALRSE